MGGLQKLKELFVRHEPLLAPMDDPFIQIDTRATSERLELRERGVEQGALEQPPSQLRALDGVESEIVAYVHEVYSRAQNDAANNVRTYDGRLAELGLLTGVSQIGVSARLAASDFKAAVTNALNRLSNSRDAITSSYSELRDFRLEHNLRRPAHRSTSSASAYGYILVSWALETGLNSVLLRQNDAMGLLGGVIAAAAIGALNVGVAAVVGRMVWPLTQHRSPAKKTLGWIGVALWLALVVTWNWGAAHYRDAKVSGVASPEVEALHLMFGSLDSIYSWALLLAGIVFAAMAALSGFRMDDPYPGYGGVSRRHDDRCQIYAEDVETATDQLTGIRDEAIDEALSVRSELDRQQSERGQILAARAAFVRRFDEFGGQLEVIANALLQEYRTANLTARSSEAPETFYARWSLPRSTVPPPPIVAVNETDIRAAEAALDVAVTEMSAAFDEGVQRFEPLETLKLRLVDA
jgi:hypothetical protein